MFSCGLITPAGLPEQRALIAEVFSQAMLDVSLAGKEFVRTRHKYESPDNPVVVHRDVVLTLIYPRVILFTFQ